jgi:hypothetical protein
MFLQPCPFIQGEVRVGEEEGEVPFEGPQARRGEKAGVKGGGVDVL